MSLSPTDPTRSKSMVNFLSSAELPSTLDGEPAAELTDEEMFNLRDSHVLFFDDQAEGAWRTQFPYLSWVREPGGDRFGLVAGELARIVLPFVRLVPPDVLAPRASAEAAAFVSMQPKPEAWTRWLQAIQDAQITPHPDSLSLWLREAATRLHSAAPDIKARLQLFYSDLVETQTVSQETVQALSPADLTAHNAGLLFTWGSLADKGDGMLRHAADMLYHSGSLMCASWRVLGSSWHSMLVTLYNIGVADGAIHASNQQDHMQVSAWFMRVSKSTLLPPELQVHYTLGFERALDLQDRLAGRPQAKNGGVHSAAGMILQRFDYVIKHFPLTSLLVATGPQHAPLHDQSLSDFIVEAARSLAPAGRQVVHSTLSLQLLRRLEGDISSNYASLLAEADFLKMHPNERLLDLESRASQSATATSAGAAYSEGILTERGATTDDGGFARVPKYWREQIKQALASPEYRAIQRDVLARLSAGGADAEADVIFLCATGESNERIELRVAAQALSASDDARAAAKALTPRFCALSFFFAHGDFAADAVDPSLRVVTEYAAEYWPGLIARRLRPWRSFHWSRQCPRHSWALAALISWRLCVGKIGTRPTLVLPCATCVRAWGATLLLAKPTSSQRRPRNSGTLEISAKRAGTTRLFSASSATRIRRQNLAGGMRLSVLLPSTSLFAESATRLIKRCAVPLTPSSPHNSSAWGGVFMRCAPQGTQWRLRLRLNSTVTP